MSMFKKAYARGVCDTLLEAGIVKFASLEDAAAVADYVGERLDFEPADGNVDAQKTAAVAVAIIEVIEKLAGGEGSLITGDKPAQHNTPANAASQIGGLAALDQKQRPQGTYAKGEAGVGNTDLKIPASAVVGNEQPHPKAPGVTSSRPNSIVEASKTGSLHELFRKIAGGEGSLITGDKAEQSNTPANAASQVGGLGALDEKQRPQGEYAKGEAGVGKSDLSTAAGEVGKLEDHPKTPGKTDDKPNSVKSASFMAHFEQTAKTYLPYLPGALGENEKVAAVKSLMGMDADEARSFIGKLAEESCRPFDGAVSEKKDEAKKDSEHEKKETPAEEKKEEKKEEEKKANAKYSDPYGYKSTKRYNGLHGQGTKTAGAVLAAILSKKS